MSRSPAPRLRHRFDVRTTMVIASASGALPLLGIALASPTFLKPGALGWLLAIVAYTLITVAISLRAGKLTEQQFVVLGIGGMIGVAISAYLIADSTGTRAVTALLAVVPAIAATRSPPPIITAVTALSLSLATILSIVTLHSVGAAVTVIAIGAGATAVLIPVILITTLRRSLSAVNRTLEVLNHRLDAAANTDPLTGILNRRGLITRAQALFDAVVAGDGHDTVLALVIDIDHFKAVNDADGHAAGDAVLVHLAQTLAAATADEEVILARLGGEEFLVLARSPGDALLEDTLLETAILDRVRAQCAVTVSIGAVHTCLTAAALDSLGAEGVIDRLIRVADRALYTAKDIGRDRIVYSHSAGDPFSLGTATRPSNAASRPISDPATASPATAGAEHQHVRVGDELS